MKIVKSKFTVSASISIAAVSPSPSDVFGGIGDEMHGVSLGVLPSSILCCAAAVPAMKNIDDIFSKAKTRRFMVFSIATTHE
jgi:hypothetical protein